MDSSLAVVIRFLLAILGAYLIKANALKAEYSDTFIEYALAFIGAGLALASLFWAGLARWTQLKRENVALALPAGSTKQDLALTVRAFNQNQLSEFGLLGGLKKILSNPATPEILKAIPKVGTAAGNTLEKLQGTDDLAMVYYRLTVIDRRLEEIEREVFGHGETVG